MYIGHGKIHKTMYEHVVHNLLPCHRRIVVAVKLLYLMISMMLLTGCLDCGSTLGFSLHRSRSVTVT
jgi:hypothetical protein